VRRAPERIARLSPIVLNERFFHFPPILHIICVIQSSRDYCKVLLKGRGRNPSVYTLPELINIVEGRRIL